MCFDSDNEDTIINYSNDLIDFTRDLVTVPVESEPKENKHLNQQ